MSHSVLGKEAREFTGELDPIPRPDHVKQVSMVSDEVTAVCPVTGQPDQYVVRIHFLPDDSCIESKSLKLYLGSFRNVGVFAEDLANIIAKQVWADIKPKHVAVTTVQKSRGGISIETVAVIEEDDR